METLFFIYIKFFDTKEIAGREETVESADENPPTNHREDTAEENHAPNYRDDSDDYREEYNTDKSQDYDGNNHIQGALLSQNLKTNVSGEGSANIFPGAVYIKRVWLLQPSTLTRIKQYLPSKE